MLRDLSVATSCWANLSPYPVSCCVGNQDSQITRHNSTSRGSNLEIFHISLCEGRGCNTIGAHHLPGWRLSRICAPRLQHPFLHFSNSSLQLYRNSPLHAGRRGTKAGGGVLAEQLSAAQGAPLPAGAEHSARQPPLPAASRPRGAAPPGTAGAARPEPARARPREAEPRRGRGSAALRRRPAGRVAAGSGSGGRRAGEPPLSCLPASLPGGSAALPGRQSRRRSKWGDGAERAARLGVGSRGQRRDGRAMPLTFLLALPFLLLFLLPALRLLFSPAAAMAGNFPEGWSQAGLVLRWAPQGTGHAVR